MRAALEITARFRELVPENPVRYDFALTRLGIRRGMDDEVRGAYECDLWNLLARGK